MSKKTTVLEDARKKLRNTYAEMWEKVGCGEEKLHRLRNRRDKKKNASTSPCSLPLSINRLDVIAFANRLDPTMVPTVVAPVFRDRERSNQAIFPPFRFNDGNVVGGTIAPVEEIADLEGRRKVTLIKEPFPARRGYELWVDEKMEPRYQPAKEAWKELREIALTAARQARRALAERRLEDAERLLAKALSADDRLLDVLVLAAALGSVQGNRTRIVLMKRAAERLGMYDSFEDALNKILADGGDKR